MALQHWREALRWSQPIIRDLNPQDGDGGFERSDQGFIPRAGEGGLCPWGPVGEKTVTDLYAEIVKSLVKKEKVALATIIQRVGSAPRAVGAKYLVKRD